MAQAIYDAEQMTVVFNATIGLTDYGVRNSPVFEEVEDVEVASIEILGCDVDFEKLPVDLQNEILRLADELEFENGDF